MRAIMEGAAETDSPVIVQASAGARKYAGPTFLRHLILAAVEEFPHIPIVMHQDHGAVPSVCQRSIQLGFSSVMMDGSLGEDQKTPMSYEYNVDVTRARRRHGACVRRIGRRRTRLSRVSLETGMGGEEDGGGHEGSLSKEMLLTDPEQAADFVKQDESGRTRDRDRHVARRVQIHASADRRHTRDRPDQRDQRGASRTRTS